MVLKLNIISLEKLDPFFVAEDIEIEPYGNTEIKLNNKQYKNQNRQVSKIKFLDDDSKQLKHFLILM